MISCQSLLPFWQNFLSFGQSSSYQHYQTTAPAATGSTLSRSTMAMPPLSTKLSRHFDKGRFKRLEQEQNDDSSSQYLYVLVSYVPYVSICVRKCYITAYTASYSLGSYSLGSYSLGSLDLRVATAKKMGVFGVYLDDFRRPLVCFRGSFIV